MKKALVFLVMAVACTALTAAVSVAQEHDHDHGSDEDMAAYMEKYMEAIAPVGHHKAFEQRVGNWQAEVKHWYAPGVEPTVHRGKATYEMVMGGRYLVQHFEADMMGMTLVGMGMSGFDRTIGKHTTFWVDNMGTSATYSEGECGDHCMKEWYMSTHTDPVTGETTEIKMVTKIIDENNHTFEMYSMAPDGSMYKSMEIVYKRG